MEKTYNPQSVESKIYRIWEDGGYFTPKIDPKKKPFTIIMPPPNANDPLHIGHAMFVAIEDILIRYHRMKGDPTLWLPGTDHAGIETQYVFEKKLAKEGKSRFNFDRKTLYQMIREYVEKNSGVAVDQMKKLGASADWGRFKFTLDSDIVNFVIDTFIKLHKDNLIERKEKLINYCPKCGTSYSDLEIEHEEKNGILYIIDYPLVNEPEKCLKVATTRPETMLGDVAVAVNPKDPRYKKYWQNHEKVRLPIVNRDIDVIEDDMVDMEFGTGVVKITPSHDRNDEAVAERKKWNLIEIYSKYTVIGFDGKMRENAGAYYGMSVDEARKQIILDLKDDIRQKPYKNTVSVCYRCGKTIEPLPRTQFFIKVKPFTSDLYNLTGEVITAMKKHWFKVYGAGRGAILQHWLENLRDWNISRQIVWGIRIPVWYKITGNEDLIAISFIDSKGQFHQGPIRQWIDKKYSHDEIERGLQQILVPFYKGRSVEHLIQKEKPTDGNIWYQETDTLDTWFSSGQWPVVTLKTNKPGDFDYFYPTSVMETGYDILPIWVLRMLMLGMYLTKNEKGDDKRVPFTDIYLHGLIRDEKGQKMSKSKGNVMNPIDMVEKYGADAIRMALVMSSTPGQDKAVGENTIRGMRNLSNKIWNAARYITRGYNDPADLDTLSRSFAGVNINEKEIQNYEEDARIKIQKVIGDVTKLLDEYKIGLAAEVVYNKFWHWFCDELIEKEKDGYIRIDLLKEIFLIFLKLLHPFMPFITEEIWGMLPRKTTDPLIISSWPK
ncbi:MAG: Valine-tRNA ligase [Microgenomates group bacterium GW2011_GWC1_43_11]|uniref:Valine--tRNA ligase n=2 Tax=Candidatus Gottesmaniibacteriota TaxID=1752720 RepID=A0A0G1KMW2_9BACT|nr:MAG: Valine-tRNA ligase [Microgenomates group bacterium GW2011_GWC1_43_11]KKT34971.1 MAG: Valine-tRNA ligase [Candidatus Gottesmanbacteria bacterium GW2011_GWB1_44_11c]KKT57602.1 MAG: Valine-tRNA ligase [Candidatus Gottesmanbacteria bacterium GW2011_GWA1_44_24b]HCM82252.1 valine--tRNA ligase [Patescibacteria group bacterium]